MFLGLVVSAVVGYSAIRLTLCLVRSHRVTPSLALSTAFRVVAFLYLVRKMVFLISVILPWPSLYNKRPLCWLMLI